MNITEEMLTELREKITPWLTGKRLVHTLAVEDMAVKLGKLYLPDQTEKLRAAALLHDITKLTGQNQFSASGNRRIKRTLRAIIFYCGIHITDPAESAFD